MNMEEIWIQGHLSESPLSFLLFRIWHSEKTGNLKIQEKSTEKNLYFKKGHLAITNACIDAKNLRQFFIEKKTLKDSDISRAEDHATHNNMSLTRSLIELQLLSPFYLWEQLQDFFKSETFPVFNWSQGEYFFDIGESFQDQNILLLVSTPLFILQGIRQMKNFDLIQAHLPPEDEEILVSSFSPNLTSLDPPEKYLLHLINNQRSLKEILDTSELGRQESQKVIFSFFSLGLVDTAKFKTHKTPSKEFSDIELPKIFEAFNKKCSYIFKYISKEIGPVALSVLEKCMEDTKVHLPPLFQEIRVGKNGIIETHPSMIKNFKPSDEETRQELLRGLNEILAAEILAVKRTLGNKHESALVKNLERIGEWN